MVSMKQYANSQNGVCTMSTSLCNIINYKLRSNVYFTC